MSKINNILIPSVQGVQGVQGSQGTLVQGLQGLIGSQGTLGISGIQGVQGATGIQGISATIRTPGLSMSSMLVYGSSTTSALTTNRLYAMPLLLGQSLTYTSLTINVSVGAVGSARILIYSDSSATPNTKLYESTDLDCSTTGIKTVSVSGTFIEGTTYWLGIYTNSTASFSFISALAAPSIRLTTITPLSYYFVAATYGTAPNPFGSPSPGTGGTPHIAINF